MGLVYLQNLTKLLHHENMYKYKSVPVGKPTGTDVKFSWYFYQSDVTTISQLFVPSCLQS